MYITKEEIQDAVYFLTKNKKGCFFKHLETDDQKRRWGIAIGFSDGFDKQKPFGTFRICSKICHNNSFMRSDFDRDFAMPVCVSGDVHDTCTELGSDYELEAKRLSNEYKETLESLRSLEEDEE